MTRSLVLALLACAVAGCAHPVADGHSTQNDVLDSFGVPTEQWMLPDGRRVFMYSNTPVGHGPVRYTVGTDGKVLASEEVLNEKHLAQLKTGATQTEVRHELGRPDERQRYALLGEDVWSWRYIADGRRMFFNAHFDSKSGALTHTSRTDDPAFLSRR